MLLAPSVQVGANWLNGLKHIIDLLHHACSCRLSADDSSVCLMCMLVQKPIIKKHKEKGIFLSAFLYNIELQLFYKMAFLTKRFMSEM